VRGALKLSSPRKEGTNKQIVDGQLSHKTSINQQEGKGTSFGFKHS